MRCSTRPARLDEAHAWIRARRRADEPWQRADETLARLRATEPPPQGVAVDGAAGVVRATGERVSLVQAAADDAAGRERLLRAAAAEGESLNVLNLPASDVLGDAFRALGGRLALRQLELRLQL